MSDQPKENRTTCPVCHGSKRRRTAKGKMIDCAACNGTGKVTEADLNAIEIAASVLSENLEDGKYYV